MGRVRGWYLLGPCRPLSADELFCFLSVAELRTEGVPLCRWAVVVCLWSCLLSDRWRCCDAQSWGVEITDHARRSEDPRARSASPENPLCLNQACCGTSIVLALPSERLSLSLWFSVMYEWIVDGLSSLFVPFSGGSQAVWPADSTGEEKAPLRTSTDTQPKQQEPYRPAKRNYQRWTRHSRQHVNILYTFKLCFLFVLVLSWIPAFM